MPCHNAWCRQVMALLKNIGENFRPATQHSLLFG
ncbi:Uncharacterised protein [Vibrio cholerae]|nr:Uncharacterised protein [Vibrio cholerae]